MTDDVELLSSCANMKQTTEEVKKKKNPRFVLSPPHSLPLQSGSYLGLGRYTAFEEPSQLFDRESVAEYIRLDLNYCRHEHI